MHAHFSEVFKFLVHSVESEIAQERVRFFLSNWRWILKQQRWIFHVSTHVKLAASHAKETEILRSLHVGWTCTLHSDWIPYFKRFCLICGSVRQSWGVILYTSSAKLCNWWQIPFIVRAAKIWRRWSLTLLFRGCFPIVWGLCNRCLIDSGSDSARDSLSRRWFVQVRDVGILVLKKIGVFERVWFVRHFLERLGLNLRPVVRWLQFHEHTVLFYLVNGRAHCGVALKYLG